MDTIYRSGHEAQMEVTSEEREKHGFNDSVGEVGEEFLNMLEELSSELQL